MLHIISNFPLSTAFLDNTNSGDTVIFTGNAILAVKQANIAKETLSQKTLSHINLCVRKADLIIKNISNSELLRGVAVIDEDQYKIATSEDLMIKSCN